MNKSFSENLIHICVMILTRAWILMLVNLCKVQEQVVKLTFILIFVLNHCTVPSSYCTFFFFLLYSYIYIYIYIYIIIVGLENKYFDFLSVIMNDFVLLKKDSLISVIIITFHRLIAHWDQPWLFSGFTCIRFLSFYRRRCLHSFRPTY